MNDLVKIQDEKQIGAMATDYAGRVDGLKITSRETYIQMVQVVKEAKQFIGAITEFFRPMKEKAYAAHRAICDQESISLAPFRKAETIGKQRMKGWEQIEEERARKAREKQMEAVKAAQANGEAPPPVVVVENKAHTIVEGVQYTDNWIGEVVDLGALLRAVLADKAPHSFVVANETEICKFARATGGKVAIPGIEWHNERIVRISA